MTKFSVEIKNERCSKKLLIWQTIDHNLPKGQYTKMTVISRFVNSCADSWHERAKRLYNGDNSGQECDN